MADIGEYAVGAWLREVAGCDFVDFNVRPRSGGREGQAEFDVLGLHFGKDVAYLCEVATHLDGLNYGGASNAYTIERVLAKYGRQRSYAEKHLDNFQHHCFMFWSPRVPVGAITEALTLETGLEIVVNAEYARRIDELRRIAKISSRETGNPFFRSLQILEHLRV